ncbi:MAG TPA: type VII secretion integral membrane protein EccD [Mycobacteriales bacterium]|nr:type VII secretion integral membrane protein EccD [Mycobacteriales bacterium]
MTRSIGIGLARVTVAAPHSRVDVALPEHELVAQLMPGLLRRAGDDLADLGQQHSGWVLRRGDGDLLDGNRTLAAQNVLDGEVLYLVPRRTDWPEPEYDDLVDAIARETRRHTRPWSPAASRALGLGGASWLLLTLLGLLVIAGPPWPAPAIIAGSVAVVLLLTAAGLARALADAGAGAVLAGTALPFAAVAAAMFTAGPLGVGELGAAQLLAGCGGLLAASIVADLAVAGRTPLFVAGTVLAILVAGGTLLRLAGLTPAGVAAVLAALVILVTPALPLLALRLGRLPTPSLPTSTADLLADEPLPARAAVQARVIRSDQVLTGIVQGGSVLLVGCQLLLAADRDVSGTVLIALIAGTALLRARLYPTLRHRLPLLLVGLGGVAVLGGTALALRTPQLLMVATAGALLLAGLAVAAGLTYSRRKAGPALGRLGDVIEVLAVLAVVPVACAVLGAYGQMRGLFG